MAVELVAMDDLKHILKETITAICRSRLHQAVQLSIEALIGVTINKTQMMLVNINEDLKSDASLPLSGITQERPLVNLPARKLPKAVRGRSSTFSSMRASNRGRPKGLKNILPRLPISATQSSTPPETSIPDIKEEKDSPPEKRSRSILLSAGDAYSPDTGELLPNPNSLIPLEPQFSPHSSKDADEDNSKSQISDMLPGIEGSRAEKSPSRQGDESINETLLSGASRASQEDEDTIGTLSMVSGTDEPFDDSLRIKQEAPDFDEGFDPDRSSSPGPSGQSPPGTGGPSPVPGQAMFPSAKILDILNQPPKTFPKECRKRKILTLERRIQVLEMLQTGRSARSIAAQLGVGRTQIQNILKEKELILSKWVQGANSDMKYINPRRRPYADVDNLVWQWFQEYSSCGVHITGKLIQHTALELAKALGNDKFSASNGWLESWQRRHNVKLSALYEAHKTKPATAGASVAAAGEEEGEETEGEKDAPESDAQSGDAQGAESESFFKSGNEVIVEPESTDEGKPDAPKEVGLMYRGPPQFPTNPNGQSAANTDGKKGLVKGLALHATKAALKSYENAKRAPPVMPHMSYGETSSLGSKVFKPGRAKSKSSENHSAPSSSSEGKNIVQKTESSEQSQTVQNQSSTDHDTNL